jgi:hypothetical protein
MRWRRWRFLWWVRECLSPLVFQIIMAVALLTVLAIHIFWFGLQILKIIIWDIMLGFEKADSGKNDEWRQ